METRSPRPRARALRVASALLAGGLVAAASASAFGGEEAAYPADSRLARAGQVRILANPLEEGVLNTTAWQMDRFGADVSDVPGRIGPRAVRVYGHSNGDTGKGDFQIAEWLPPRVEAFGMWVHLAPGHNVKEIGFQVYDQESECFIVLKPADWEGWGWLEATPDEFKPAYVQADKNGTIDSSIRGLNVAWFSAGPGDSSATIDGLTLALADADPNAKPWASMAGPDHARGPGEVYERVLTLNNPTARAVTGKAAFSLQANDQLYDLPLSDATYGPDRARRQPSWLVVDGRRQDNNACTDGDDYSEAGIEGKRAEIEQYIDLGRVFDGVNRLTFLSGDFNWIWFAEVSASTDGAAYTVVPGLEKINLHQAWGRRNFDPAAPFAARYLKLRYHRDGAEADRFRLARTIAVHAGLAGEPLELPTTGASLETAEYDIAIPAGAFSVLTLQGKTPLDPGAYFAGVTLTGDIGPAIAGGNWFVPPEPFKFADEAALAASRFGMNGSSPEIYGESMARAGFSWYRFENLKWLMTAPNATTIEFDGSVGPWHVPQDKIMEQTNGAGLLYYPYIQMIPEWASSAPADANNRISWPPTSNDLFRDYCFQVVARYGAVKHPEDKLVPHDKKTGLDYFKIIELWNEADLEPKRKPDDRPSSWAPWTGTIPQWFEFFRAGAEGVLAADPDMKISHGAWSAMELEVVGDLHHYQYADGKRPVDFTDILNIHFYTGRADPETTNDDPNANRTGQKPRAGSRTYEDNLRSLVAWRDDFMPGKEIWLTEIGNDVGGPMGRTERYQAAKLPRAIMMALANGVDKAMIYREAGSDESQHAGAGLHRNDRSVRPVWYTCATMIRQLDGIPGKALRLDTSETARLYVWTRPDGSRIVTGWTALDDGEALGLDLGACDVVDAFGGASRATLGADHKLTLFPLYIRSVGNPAALDAAVAKAEAREKAWADDQARFARKTPVLLDFGTAERVGALKDYGPLRRFTAVQFNEEWDATKGYGFLPGPDRELGDQRWMPNPIENDHVLARGGATFQLALPAGDYDLEVMTRILWDGDHDRTVTVTDAAGKEFKQPTDRHEPAVMKVAVKGGAKPITVKTPPLTALYSIIALPK